MDHRPNQSWSPPIHLHHPLSSRSTSMETPTQYLLYISTYQAQLNLLSALPFSIVRVVTIKRGMRRWDGPGNWGQVTLDTGHWTSNHNMTPITALASSPPTPDLSWFFSMLWKVFRKNTKFISCLYLGFWHFKMDGNVSMNTYYMICNESLISFRR